VRCGDLQVNCTTWYYMNKAKAWDGILGHSQRGGIGDQMAAKHTTATPAFSRSEIEGDGVPGTKNFDSDVLLLKTSGLNRRRGRNNRTTYVLVLRHKSRERLQA
jgi:hypothetical protein